MAITTTLTDWLIEQEAEDDARREYLEAKAEDFIDREADEAREREVFE